MTNKRNVVLQSTTVLFLVALADTTQVRRANTEQREHSYSILRQILREFTVEQLIRLVDRMKLKMDAIFASDLVLPRKERGHISTSPEYTQA